MACQYLRPASGLRDGHHPDHRRRRHRRLQQAQRRPLPQRRPPHRRGRHDRCRARRRRRSRPSSPTRSRRRSTPSAASTSCARSRPRACRRSSSASSWTRTSTSPRRRCASTCPWCCPTCPKGRRARSISKLDPDAAPVLFLALESPRPDPRGHRVRRPRGAAGAGERPGVGQVTIVGGRKRQIQVDARSARAARRRAHAPSTSSAPIVVAEHHDAGRRRRHGPAAAHLPRQRPRRAASGDRARSSCAASRATRSWCATSARVVDGEEEAETAASIDGKPAVVLSIRKQSGANSVAVVDALHGARRRSSSRRCPRATRSKSSATTPRPRAPASTP